jgi:hypothetical protein
MTIWERVSAALAILSTPLAANRYLVPTGAELPDQYLVYQLISDPAAQHADNQETLREYRVQVSVYSRSGLAVLPVAVENAMLAAGFTRLSAVERPYNESTRHFGLAIDFSYLEERNEP